MKARVFYLFSRFIYQAKTIIQSQISGQVVSNIISQLHVDGVGDVGVGGHLGLDLHGGGLVGEGADKAVSVAKLGDGDGDLCLDDGVDTANFVRDLPCAFEEKGISNVAFYFLFRHLDDEG